MKVSHEIPFSLMEESRGFNDFDYALVHLFPENPTYFSFFKDSLTLGREVVLDNSVFELGSPVSDEFYSEWILKLNPSYFIAPDKFEDSDFTIDSVLKWKKWASENNQKMIGVVQGKSFVDMLRCYKEIEPYCDKIAISFAQPLFSSTVALPTDEARIFGRFILINALIETGILNPNKKHHLLGCSLPQELSFYKHKRFNFIDSVDSSSPVLHGYEGVSYETFGLKKKIKKKLVDIMDKPIKNRDVIDYNIKLFKSFI